MRTPLVLEVARWELLRFFKLKDQIVGLVVLLVAGLGFYAVSALVARSARAPVRIAVVGGAAADFAPVAGARFEWLDARGPDPSLRDRVESRDLDGVLTLGPDGAAGLLARRAPPWQGDLQAVLDERLRRRRLAETRLDPAVLERLTSPAVLDVVTLAPELASGRGGGWAAGIAIGLMLLGVMIGNAYLLVGITGEKQLRITEQVVAAIRPQTWIDGKILGLSAFTLIEIVIYVVPTVVTAVIVRRLGGPVPALPTVEAPFLGWLLVFSVLGFLLWFTAFAAIAATVDDPNTSSRGGWLMFPLLPLGLAFVVLRDPDTVLARVLGVLPPTAPTVMPVRLLLTQVPAWEVLLAVAGLAGAIWLLRRAAGKIFQVGMQAYGKEPSWREIWRWARAAD